MDYRDVVNSIDYEKASKIVTKFIRDVVDSAGSRGVVAGVSGGVDSTVAIAFAVKALGPDRVLGLIMPSKSTPKEDIDDANYVCYTLGIKCIYIDIDPVIEAYSKVIPDYNRGGKIPIGNLQPRIRMTILYFYANLYNYLVLGSSDKSELLLGYFTKYGDGGVDLMPLGDLYKVQVKKFAEILGFSRIALKPSSPRLWPAHTAAEELGATYEEIDPVLYAIFDLNKPLEEVYTMFRRDLVDMVIKRYRANEHKRRTPPIAYISEAKIFKHF